MAAASAIRDDARPRSIAEVAEEFGVTHRTVRYYESEGLIDPERRGTRRLYHPRDRVRLSLVLRGRRLGFALDEIRRIVDMYDETPGEVGQMRYLLDRVDERRADLLTRRADIDATIAELDDVAARCHSELAARDTQGATLASGKPAGDGGGRR